MTNLYTLDHSCITGYETMILSNNTTAFYYKTLHHVHLLYLKNTLYTSMIFCFLVTFPLKLSNLSLLLNISFQLHLTIKIKHIIQLYKNKHTPTTNFSSLQSKPFCLWYKLNKKLNINSTPHQSKMLLTNSPQS